MLSRGAVLSIPDYVNTYKFKLNFVKGIETDNGDRFKDFLPVTTLKRIQYEFDPRHSVMRRLQKDIFPLCRYKHHLDVVKHLVVEYIVGLTNANKFRARVRKVFKKYPAIAEALIKLKNEHLDVSGYVLTKPWRVAACLYYTQPCFGCRMRPECKKAKKREQVYGCADFKPSLTKILSYYHMGLSDYILIKITIDKNKLLRRAVHEMFEKQEFVTKITANKKHVAAALNMVRDYIHTLVQYGVRTKSKKYTSVKFILNYYNEFEQKDVEFKLEADAMVAFCKVFGRVSLKKCINTMKSAVKSRIINFIKKHTRQKRARIIEDDSGVRAYICRESSMQQEELQAQLESLYAYDSTGDTVGRIHARQILEKTADYFRGLAGKIAPVWAFNKKIEFCTTLLDSDKLRSFFKWAIDNDKDVVSAKGVLMSLREYLNIHPATYNKVVEAMKQFMDLSRREAAAIAGLPLDDEALA